MISHLIFHGNIDYIFLPPDDVAVTVSTTNQYDNAPGGWRDTMAEMDAIDPGYGDIVGIYPNHCFIPSVSSLDLNTTNLFYNIAGDPNILHTRRSTPSISRRPTRSMWTSTPRTPPGS